MSESSGAPGGATRAAPSPFVVARVTANARDMEAIDAIARASSMEASFSTATELERPWARVWAARGQEEDAAPVGFLVGWHVADELHILNVATAPEARRRGIGAALITEALAYAAEQSVRLLLLEVRRSNEEARRLYQRFGFAVTGIRQGYYADNGEDAVEMLLKLDPDADRSSAEDREIRIDV